jgi:hypothetical protein
MDPRVTNLLDQLEPELAARLDQEIEGWRDMTPDEFQAACKAQIDAILDFYNHLKERP